MQCRLEKMGSVLVPWDDATREWMETKRDGTYLVADVVAPRNYEFHKKFFALLNATFPLWEPAPLPDGTEVTKDFDQYREDVTILAGHFRQVFSASGNAFVIRAKSISFAAMDEEQFKRFYDAALNAILMHVLVGWTIEEVDDLIGSFL